MAFVSYGSTGGAHAVQPIRNSVHIAANVLWAHFKGGDVAAGLAEQVGQAKSLIDDLLWWTNALKSGRSK